MMLLLFRIIKDFKPIHTTQLLTQGIKSMSDTDSLSCPVLSDIKWRMYLTVREKETTAASRQAVGKK